MDIQQSIFSDPMYQMMQGRSGLAPDQYWNSLHPEAKKQHLSRINADPATYVTEEQYGNSQAVGANSGPNAFVSDNPVLAGYDGDPVQPGYPSAGPSTESSPALSSSIDRMIPQDTPEVLQGAPVLTNPDGTVVEPDSGALVSTSNVNGAPSSTNNSTTQSTSRTASPSTGNARGSQMGYGKANTAEMLMRVGGAMQAGAANGYGAAMGAASNEYGKIQDQRRAADTAAFEQAEATRLKEEAMKAAAARARSSGGGKAAAVKSKALTGVNDAMYSMQRGLDAIADSRASGGNLTGVGGIFKGAFDNFTGDADANRRLILSRLKIDDTLLRTAETKGAISNVEMALFLEPAPKTIQDEQIWVDWLNERMRTLRAVQYRLQTGEELPLDQRSQKYDPSTGAPSNSSLSDDDMAYIK